jgi:hypothetical protein
MVKELSRAEASVKNDEDVVIGELTEDVFRAAAMTNRRMLGAQRLTAPPIMP